MRGDSGFCRQRLIRGCERQNVKYVIGLARNRRLQDAVTDWEAELETQYKATQIKQRAIHEFPYAAKSWDCERRIITRLEFGTQGINPRFIVTKLKTSAETLYDEVYCQGGEAEN